jgi:hypothetical protein
VSDTFGVQMSNCKVRGTTFVAEHRLRMWFATARRGARMVYATGNLARDRSNSYDFGGLLNASANYVRRLQMQGYVELVQKRIGFDEYEYRVLKI